MWRYCSGVPLFVTVSLQTGDMRRRQREREPWGGGGGWSGSERKESVKKTLNYVIKNNE